MINTLCRVALSVWLHRPGAAPVREHSRHHCAWLPLSRSWGVWRVKSVEIR